MSLCEYCGKSFANKYVLKKHMDTAEFCLKLQDKELPQHLCHLCGKCFTLKPNLDTHIKTCRGKIVAKNPEFALRAEKNKDLEQIIADLILKTEIFEKKFEEIEKERFLDKKRIEYLEKYISEIHTFQPKNISIKSKKLHRGQNASPYGEDNGKEVITNQLKIKKSSNFEEIDVDSYFSQEKKKYKEEIFKNIPTNRIQPLTDEIIINAAKQITVDNLATKGEDFVIKFFCKLTFLKEKEIIYKNLIMFRDKCYRLKFQDNNPKWEFTNITTLIKLFINTLNDNLISECPKETDLIKLSVPAIKKEAGMLWFAIFRHQLCGDNLIGRIKNSIQTI
jgi:hypothetical protein